MFDSVDSAKVMVGQRFMQCIMHSVCVYVVVGGGGGGGERERGAGGLKM